MALTKVTKSGITDNSIDADKIEDGTIVAADIADGTITNAKLAGSIANDKLANSAITVNGTSVSLGGSVSAGKIQWQAVKTSGFTAVAGEGYFCNTNGGAFTATLPASPSAGDTVAFKDYGGDFGTNSLTIARNGKNIQGVANDSEISTNRASIVCVFIDDTKGWLYTNESNVADLQEATFITATGGTITTVDTNYKVHTFTGDGCFVVSAVGNPVGSTSVDYLVVAGGAGGGWANGGGGGGGAGGLRYTASTYSNPTPAGGIAGSALAVSVTTYPITVGGGGSGVSGTPSYKTGIPGSNSIFSTITSAGGGGGGGGQCCSNANGLTGGSGGGGGKGGPTYGSPGGTGNTPPVSPSQGNTGGHGGAPATGAPSPNLGGGGGGHSATGQNVTGNFGGDGGNGSVVAINGSCGAYAGGGGGQNEGQPAPLQGSGGSGGGGAAGVTGVDGSGGSTNTGGGGGGADSSPAGPVNSGNGGSGIVIIRYKFQ